MTEHRVPESVLAANLQDEAVLLHMDTKRYYQLNETGQFIWKLLERGTGAQEIVAQLVETYDVSMDVAAAEYERLIDELSTHGLIEPGEPDRR
jgi:hypothetical protein